EQFIDRLGHEVRLRVPDAVPISAEVQFALIAKGKPVKGGRARFTDLLDLAGVKLKLDKDNHAQLNDLLEMAAQKDPEKMREYRRKVGDGVQESLRQQFSKFDLTGKTWAALTKAQSPGGGQAG